MDAATVSDTVIVAPGRYVENVFVNKPLTIKSSGGAAMTVVQSASANKDIVSLTGSDVRIDGFTIIGTMVARG